jgi:ferric-dicitrate binding protein FerR (iron transport regulator)
MSANFSNVQEDLLVKYLLGEATDAERNEVNEWINASGENKKYYEHFSLIWNESKKIEASSTINVEDAWNKFRERTKKSEDRSTESETKVIDFPVKKFSWVRAAAVLALVAGAGWIAYMIGANDNGKLMAVNSGSAVLVDTLPDGSVVTLNKNSSITYNSKLDGDIRSVKLEGEAFFNVAPDKQHPFVIDANGTTVTVVGTAFNVKCSERKTEVVVESGIVDVAKNQKGVRLIANEKATVLDYKDAPIKSSSEDELYNYYKTKKFVCNNTPISRLVEVLSEAYGVEIVIENNSIGHLPMFTTFDMDSVRESLNTIKRTYPHIEITEEGGKYILQ